jgi:hypothetical protein
VIVFLPLLAAPVAVERQDNPPDEDGSPDPEIPDRVPVCGTVTSTDGPLQQRLLEAFPESFEKGIDIIWQAGESWVSPEVFDWWAFRVDPAGLTPAGAERMFAELSDRKSVFPEPGTGTNCAVVGASRNLLGARYGRLIDAHDLVFRVNRAPKDGYAADVGRKTTHHVMWPTDRTEDQADRRSFLLLNPMTLHTPDLFDRIVTLVEDELHWEKERVRLIHPEFVMHLHRDWMEARGGFPSTGFIALMIAVQVCDEVDVFGFGADAQGRWDRYYEDDPAVPTDLHPAAFEGRFRTEMESKGIVKVFLGNRSADGVGFPGFQTDEKEGN